MHPGAPNDEATFKKGREHTVVFLDLRSPDGVQTHPSTCPRDLCSSKGVNSRFYPSYNAKSPISVYNKIGFQVEFYPNSILGDN